MDGEGGGKAVWEVSPEKREVSLRERKAKMILSARQCVFFSFCSRSRSFYLLEYGDRRLLEQQKAPDMNAKS